MRKNVRWALFVTAASLGLMSCIVAVVDTSYSGRIPGWGEFRRLIPFQGGGTIMLENSRGDIELFGWDRAEVEIVAWDEGSYLKPGFYWWDFPDRRDLEDRVLIDRFDDLLKVKTRRDGRDWQGLDYELHVPASVNLNSLSSEEGDILVSGVYGRAVVNLRKGDIRVENFSGSLDVSAGEGDVEAELLDLRQGDEVRITASEGDIVLYLENEVSARVEASAPEGQVESEFDLAEKLPGQKARGQLADGQALISLTAVRGRISIVKIKE